MVTVTNIVPEPPQATKRIDPANYVDPHCNTCQRKLDTRQITTAFQCHIEGCMEVCHKAIRCSGIRYAQGEKEKKAWEYKIWLCSAHDTNPKPIDELQPLALPPKPISLGELMKQGLSLAEAKAAKPKCSLCKKTLRSNAVPVRCCSCGDNFHTHCSVGRANTNRNLWRCDRCQQGDIPRPIVPEGPFQPDGPESSTYYKARASSNLVTGEPTPQVQNSVLQPPNLPQTDSNSNGLSPLIQSASLSPSLTEDSNISSPTRPVANSGSQSFVSIASNPPSDGLPNGSVLSEDSRNNEVPKKRLGRTSRPLTIMQWNADGIGNKIFELKEYLVNSNVDVLAVQESKLLSTGPKADKDPPILGYYIQRKDREGAETRDDSLLFYIKDDV